MADAPDPLGVDALIERIVRDANLASARDRDALRRELVAHFEDAANAGASNEADVLERFGDPALVADGFRRAYRRGRRTLYVAKIVASAAPASVVALAINLPMYLEPSPHAIALSPLFALAARISIAAVLAAVAAWELDVEWLCSRLERHPVRLVACWLALFAVMSAAHAYLGMHALMLRALFGAATLLAVWTSSVAILSRSDWLFLRFVGGDV